MRAIEWKNIYRLSHPKQMGLIAITHALHEFYCVALPPIIPLIVIDFDMNISNTVIDMISTIYGFTAVCSFFNAITIQVPDILQNTKTTTLLTKLSIYISPKAVIF